MNADGQTDGRNGRTDGQRQNYIPPTLSGDNKGKDQPAKQSNWRLCYLLFHNVTFNSQHPNFQDSC